MVNEETVRAALQEVFDPEIPISVVALGLIQRIEVTAAGDVTVSVGFTSLGCPCTDIINEDITNRIRAIDGVRSVTLEEGFARWSKARISKAGLRSLQVLGIG